MLILVQLQRIMFLTGVNNPFICALANQTSHFYVVEQSVQSADQAVLSAHKINCGELGRQPDLRIATSIGKRQNLLDRSLLLAA